MNNTNARLLFETQNLQFSYTERENCGFFERRTQRRQEAKKITFPDLQIFEGERVAFLGSNGCGKTTLLKLLNGLLQPSGGSILYCAEETAHSSRLRAETVYVHQHPYLLAGTVQYNVEYAIRQPKTERSAAAKIALHLFALEGFEKRQAQKLSGGEAQRTALARVIATGAKVLLLDEPTASADAASAELILTRLKELSGYTIIFSTHNERFAKELAKKIVIM